MTWARAKVQTPPLDERVPRPVSHTVGFALGVAGATCAAMVVRDWWGPLVSAEGLSLMNLPLVLLVFGLAISVLGWWLTSTDSGAGSLALAMSRAVATVGCVLAGLAAVHFLSAKLPVLLGVTVEHYSVPPLEWSFYLKYDGLLAIAALVLAAAGFALERRLIRAS
jgi:hypothetical protein